MKKALQLAERVLSAGRWAEGLRHLLTAYGECRAVVLAELIDEVSELAQRGVQQLATGKRTAMQKEWLVLAAKRQPEDVPRLLQALTQTHFRATEARVRARKIKGWPVDPRIPALLVDQLLHPPFHASSSKPFWTDVFRLIALHADPRTPALLRNYLARLSTVLREPQVRPMRNWFRARAEQTLSEVEQAFSPPPMLPDAAAEWVARCRRILEKRADRLAAMLDAVFTDPNDMAARSVLADYLQEEGDVRGEFIVLQVRHAAGEGTATSLARERELFEKHSARWLGPLREVLEPAHCVFERGFLSQARLRERGTTALHNLVGHAWWSTVTAIHGPWTPELEAVVRHPAMRSLQHLSTTTEVFAAKRLELTSVTVPGPDFRLTTRRGRSPTTRGGKYFEVLDRREVELMATSRTFRSLEHLGLTYLSEELNGPLDFLKQIGWVKRLRHLTLFADALDRAPLAVLVKALEWLPGLRTLSLERHGREWAIVLQRAKKGRWTSVDLLTSRSWFRNLWPAVEEAVELGVRKVTIRVAPEPQPAQHKRIAELAARSPTLQLALLGPPSWFVQLAGTMSLGDWWRWLPEQLRGQFSIRLANPVAR